MEENKLKGRTVLPETELTMKGEELIYFSQQLTEIINSQLSPTYGPDKQPNGTTITPIGYRLMGVVEELKTVWWSRAQEEGKTVSIEEYEKNLQVKELEENQVDLEVVAKD